MSGSMTSFTRGENPLRADKLNKAFGERVLRSGDTMTGPLILYRDPQVLMEAATKQYVDTQVANVPGGGGGGSGSYLPLSGGTLTGPLFVNAPADPSVYITASQPGSGGNRAVWPALVFNSTQADTAAGYIEANRYGLGRWTLEFGGTEPETGSNVGTNFLLNSFSDAGTYLATTIKIVRSTGIATFIATPLHPTPTSTDNSTKSATTAFVKTVLTPYALTTSLPGLATIPVPGIVKPDGTTIVVDGAGTLTVVGTAGGTGPPAPSSTLPLMDGVGAIGVSTAYTREDHRHPSDTSKLALTGGTLTGPLLLAADPTVALQAATKQYVDAHAGSGGGAGSTWDSGSSTWDGGSSAWDGGSGGTSVFPSTTLPLADGVAAIGVLATYARADHVHPLTTSGGPAPSTTLPLMDGAAAIGTGTTYARNDHIHPSDTSRYAASNPSGYQTAAQVSALVPAASSSLPVMDSTAAVGVSTAWARGDHRHPSDTSRYAATNPSGYQTAAQVASAVAPYLPLAGGTVTGTLTTNVLRMGTLGWLEAIIGATETNTDTTMLAKRANAAGVFATRTSDGGATGAMGAWAIGGFAINNNSTTAVQTAYCQYLEYRRSANAGTTHGIEIGGINLGSVANVSPYGGQTGSTLSLWLSAGRQDVTGNDLSLAIGIIANPNRYTKGIMFSQNSLVPLDDIGGVAMALPAQYAHVWYLPEGAGASAAGIPAALIRSDIVTSPGGTVVPSLIFAGSGAVIETANGTTAADFQNGLNTFQNTKVDGNFHSTGNVLADGIIYVAHMNAGLPGFNDDAAAAAGGIPIGGVYIGLTNQNALTVRLT